MKVNDFVNVVNSAPRIVAVFRITKLPNWLKEYNKVLKDKFEIGTLMYWDGDTLRSVVQMNGITGGHRIDIPTGCVEFVDYRQI